MSEDSQVPEAVLSLSLNISDGQVPEAVLTLFQYLKIARYLEQY